MHEFRPAHLATITQGRWHAGEPEIIRGFSFDTRRIAINQCFVALRSGKRDGHDFVADATAAGASCALTDRALGCDLPQLVVADPLIAMGQIATDVRSKFMKPVIGITGSCGKTSTKEMLRLLLGEASTHATSGNWNNRIGVPMTLFDLDPPQHDFAVIEAGINQPGEMAMLGQMIHADLSILTNIGPAHLELLGSLDGIAEEKSKLASCAKPDAPLVLPLAALQYSPYAKMAKRCIALRFGEAEVPDGLGELVDCSIESSRDGTAYRLLIDGDRYEVMSSSLGIAQNAALAIVAARRLGISSGLSAKRIAEWSPESTRGRIVSLDSAYFYIDCYNANPASMADAIKAFQKTAPADLPRCYVLGAMNELGVSSADYHLTVGAGLALRPQDMAVFVGPQGLTEAYLCGAKKSGAEQNQIECVQNTKEAESIVAEFKGALFLKGSRSYQLESLLSESIP